VSFEVRLSREAQEDLVRLFDFVLERELARDGGRLELAEQALDAIRDGLRLLERSPFTCRKATAANPFLRELVIPFGHSGYVALFEIVNQRQVVVAAVRHQREDDYRR
jgi:plasmid stabilization system protein ParE